MKTLKYSRQRESIKACLMGRRDHPTADHVYLSIRQQYPNISLGTVYRNLNLLVELGDVRKLSFGCGPDRFDADLTPHYHFVCRQCGAIADLPMKTSSRLNLEAQQFCEGVIDSHLTYFYGLCKDCMSDRITKEP
ncbi:MAG: transcriptional repressor [Hungatella sp.]|jgi:Fur family peroxide stress response transcriptional regulator|nr:transcriptional repressor [Hungatella sp.]